MNLQKTLNNADYLKPLDLLAKQAVEGFVSGLHKSPFHGFSAEFAEHKIYNRGESTRHIDWKLFAKTDKLYTKRYDDETNLRCHIIVDNSSSMHYPSVETVSLEHLNKIGFSALATAALMQILKKQRDTVGLSIYSDTYEYYAPEKGSERHHQNLLKKLSDMLSQKKRNTATETYKYLHEIAEKIHKRSMIFLFTDMFQPEQDHAQLFEALQHLRYNKHEVILFHVHDADKELDFNFSNTPKRFVDVETGASINLYADTIRSGYQQAVRDYFQALRLKCAQYNIKYVPADINQGFDNILTNYLVARQKFR